MKYVISVLNKKGGAGKTTTAISLASGLHRDGKNVVLIDADRQGTARKWMSWGQCGFPVIALSSFEEFVQFDQITKPYDFVVIDGPPGTDTNPAQVTLSALKLSDLVVIPIQPSPFDIEASQDLFELIKERQSLMEGRPKSAVLLTMAVQNTRNLRKATEYLDTVGLPVFDAMTTVLMDWPDSEGAGMTPVSYAPKGRAAEQEISIYNEFKERFL
jgi:chromosome partitioning protein